MVAKQRNGGKRKGSNASPKSNSGRLFKDVVGAQMGIWKKWSQDTGADISEAAKEVAPIVAQYWGKMFAAIWNSALETRSRQDTPAEPDELRRYMLVSYNEMMKKVLATKAFASKSGKSVKGMLDNVTAWNDVMEDTLRALHLPTRGDIDELHEALHSLNRRVDYLAKALKTGGSRRTAR